MSILERRCVEQLGSRDADEVPVSEIVAKFWKYQNWNQSMTTVDP